MADVKTEEFQQASSDVLANEKFQAHLSRSMGVFDLARKDAIDELSESRWEELREEGRQIKAHTLRFWEKEFDALQPMTRKGGRRYYTKKDIDLLLDLCTKH